MTKQDKTPIVTKVLFIIFVLAAIVIVWQVVNKTMNPESEYQIYLNETEVNNITYQTVNSIKMIEEGRYPDYVICYSYCINLGNTYNSTEVFEQCRFECIDGFGVEESISIYELDEEWLIENCINNLVCATDVQGNPTDDCLGSYQCGDYKIEVMGGTN